MKLTQAGVGNVSTQAEVLAGVVGRPPVGGVNLGLTFRQELGLNQSYPCGQLVLRSSKAR